MDKIWDRNPSKSEVIGLCGGDEKNKNKTKKKPTFKDLFICILSLVLKFDFIFPLECNIRSVLIFM